MQYAKTLSGVWFDPTKDEMRLLTKARIHQSEGYTSGDVTVCVFWDADCLDSGWVAIDPKP